MAFLSPVTLRRSDRSAGEWASGNTRFGCWFGDLEQRAIQSSLDAAIHKGLGSLSNSWHERASVWANQRGYKVCFAAGTKLLSKGAWGEGWREIELITTDDFVALRDEHNPAGQIEWKAVEELFQRTSPVMSLSVNGQIIRTTAEHPFYHEEKGWTSAGELEVGDRLVGQHGEQVIVNQVEAGGEFEAVYNLRVADYHTYFVGDDSWGFGVWAHNHNGCSGKAGRDGTKLLDDGFQEVDPTVKTDMLRNAPGIAHGGESLPALATGQIWLDKATGSVGRVPHEVASQLRGRSFSDWRNFRQEFWKAVGAVPELLAQFRPDNQARILAGKAPISPKNAHVGNRRGFELDHMDPLDITGSRGVYDLDNIMVAPPKVNLSFESF